MDPTEINDARDEYLVQLDEFHPNGADGTERKKIREKSGHRWTAGMVMSDGDLVGSHLLEWVGPERGPMGRIRLTNEGRFWAGAKRAATERGQTVKAYLIRGLDSLS
jgi:hypothetical protein